MIFTNIMKVSYRRNIPINEIAKKDLAQDSMEYIWENGNNLDKRGNPIIISEFASKKNKKKIFYKIYYYVMANIKKYSNKSKERNLIENLDIETEKENDEKWIFENLNDKKEQEICNYILRAGNLDGSTKEEILKKYNMPKNELEEFLDKLYKRLKKQCIGVEEE